MERDRPLWVCPGCRRLHEGRLELRTLDRDGAALRCGCGQAYPVVDEVAVVCADAAARVAQTDAELTALADAAGCGATLEVPGPDDGALARLAEYLGTYLDAHWGDVATPPPDGPGAATVAQALWARLGARAIAPVPAAVELGCSAGRGLAELARGADRVVGLDLSLAPLRLARRLLDGAPVEAWRRHTGRHYQRVALRAGALAPRPGQVALVCADALDPPLVPAAYQRVVALNLLDSIGDPDQLLRVVAGLCAPGGEVILASPFAWSSAVVADQHRLGPDPVTELVGRLARGDGLGARFVVEEQVDLPWTLRRDGRSALVHSIHYLRLRKTG
ncbi:MAG: methyltransferase domain-containing protein [Kofleriaceae bacterium]|nr:methyltransferase domain-containing protein [Kofleriaceae bacterium]